MTERATGKIKSDSKINACVGRMEVKTLDATKRVDVTSHMNRDKVSVKLAKGEAKILIPSCDSGLNTKKAMESKIVVGEGKSQDQGLNSFG